MVGVRRSVDSSGDGALHQRPACIFIPTLTAGGAERVASILAERWSAILPVIVVTYFDEPAFFGVDPPVEVLCLGMKPHRKTFPRMFDVALAALRFRWIVMRSQPAFVLSFMNKYNAFCLAALRGTGIPVIVSERDSPTEHLPRIRECARNALYPLAAGVICQTGAGLDFINSQTSIGNATVIPNPVLRIADPLSREPERMVLGVGRFVPKKGFDQLIEAFAAMRAKRWRLVLCGDGPMRAELELLGQKLGIGDRIEFPGLVKDLRPFYNRAGMFAFPSLFEGFPNALAEALVSGLPCISYDCPTGPSDLIIDEESGLLLPVGDVAAMTGALDLLAEDHNLATRLGTRAADLAERLHPARVAEQYLAFCQAAAW